MPRDDLTIDFVAPPHSGPFHAKLQSKSKQKSKLGMMRQNELQDSAAVLEEWTFRAANLPNEIVFMQEELEEKDRQMNECLTTIHKNDGAIQKWIKINGVHTPNPKEDALRKIINENYDKAQILQAEKLALTEKTQRVVDRHTKWIDEQIESLKEKGEFPEDPDLPSIFNRKGPDTTTRIDTNITGMPLGQITNSAAIANARYPNQIPARMLPAQVQASTTGPTTPTAPAAAMLLHRNVRETSLGAAAAASKRQRLTGGLGALPANSSGLARNSSMTPGTPRAGTPTAARAGSAQPRAAQKTTTGIKKVAPQGSRQSGAPRKLKPGKSNLGRLKKPPNRNSPSSTNDSELSDAESGSVDEDDEAVTPLQAGKDAEGDEDMADIDDEENGDDKKYCICQSVSYGDMVACDNDQCPYEWFHWTCVGLKSEPAGTWICPVCTKRK